MDEKKEQSSILVIDDSSEFCEIISAKLKAIGFNIYTTNSGESGIAKASETMPDLILLDIEMPNMSGPQVLNKIKSDPALQDLNVAFLTNHGESSEESAWLDKKFASEIGAVGYIRKTDDLNKIVESVQQILKNATTPVN